ncbi:hypothetical protein D9757_002037 [Collybiopsis confluens]|uniref:Sfi1 spindle body domain-containing protein n=1 Tax=Collybiopsis confluens TaxID=2823264 RepID=A0A8H5MF47_9AGAR|nr:hypothetical protein D9757_002037 [Collybiopsis confluens]
MFDFRPPRSSSPVTQQRYRLSAASTDASRSFVSATPELAGLSVEEVDLLDAIIERAGPTATTFLTVFKAYNDILSERGLDPHEVVFYGKLLKLGTLKGGSWRDKWDAIKTQHRYLSGSQPIPADSGPVSKATARAGIASDLRSGLALSDDLSSSGVRDSHFSEADDTSITDNPPTNAPSSTVFPSRQGLDESDLLESSLGLNFGPTPRPFSPAPPPALSRATARIWKHDVSESVTSTSPYRAGARDLPYRQIPLISTDPPPRKIQSLPAPVIGKPINEEDAWKKVKMMQDEREADRFRDERLLERCFDVWRQGFQWIATTNKQIDDARDNLLIRKFFQHWHRRMESYRTLYNQIEASANRRFQRIFYHTWKQCLKARMKQKLQAQWRQEMRTKIHLLRQKRDNRILREAWDNFMWSHRLFTADRHYDGQLLIRLLRRWKAKLHNEYERETVANDVFRGRLSSVVEICWDRWRVSTDLVRIEKVVKERAGLRIMGEVLDTWNGKMNDLHIADSFYHSLLAKRCIKSWKVARDRVQNLESRVNKHMSRQDDVLLRAVMRVWKAHERGKLLEKVKAFRLTKIAWMVWKSRMNDQQTFEDLALRFSTRHYSLVARRVFLSWQQALSSHREMNLAARHFLTQITLRRAVLQWRLHLHEQLKMSRKARIADRFFILRTAWSDFKNKFRERTAAKKLQAFERLRMKRVFEEWLSRFHQSRHQRLSEDLLRGQIQRRILSKILTHWTNRVIEIKVRELEVTQRNETAILIMTYQKWKNIRARHVEELGLMQSYQDIRKEENVRRIFLKWLAAARAARHRRSLLQQKEEEIKLTAIAVVWDQWRERFQEQRLRPMEHQFYLQSREALKYRAFATWLTRTQSLPAIHFDSKHVKTKFWKIWAGTMPRALQARKAREVDKHATLKLFLERWLRVYRTRLSLKAVARARYFPAPSATASRPQPISRSFAPPRSFAPRSTPSRNNFPRRMTRSPSPDENSSDAEGAIPRRLGLTSRLAVPSRARSEASPTRTLISATRASSPIRSTKSSVPVTWHRRDRSPFRSPAPPSDSVWQELRDARKMS